VPFHIHGESATRAQAADAAGRPGLRQRGQEIDDEIPLAIAAMALDQHFANPGGEAEVAVDLERRVTVEEVGHGAAAQQFGAVDGGGVAIAQAGEEVDGPRAAPTGAGTALGEAGVDGLARGGEEDRACPA